MKLILFIVPFVVWYFFGFMIAAVSAVLMCVLYFLSRKSDITTTKSPDDGVDGNNSNIIDFSKITKSPNRFVSSRGKYLKKKDGHILYSEEYIIYNYLNVDDGDDRVYDSLYGLGSYERYKYFKRLNINDNSLSYLDKVKIESDLVDEGARVLKIDGDLEKSKNVNRYRIYHNVVILYKNVENGYAVFCGIEYNKLNDRYFFIGVNIGEYQTCGQYLGYSRNDPTSWDDDGTRPIYSSGPTYSVVSSVDKKHFNDYEEMLAYMLYNKYDMSYLRFYGKSERERYSNFMNKYNRVR